MMQAQQRQAYALPPPTLKDFPGINSAINRQDFFGYYCVGFGAVMAYHFMLEPFPITTFLSVIAMASGVGVNRTVAKTRSGIETDLSKLTEPKVLKRSSKWLGHWAVVRAEYRVPENTLVSEIERYIQSYNMPVSRGIHHTFWNGLLPQDVVETGSKDTHIFSKRWPIPLIETNLQRRDGITTVDAISLGDASQTQLDGLLARLASVQ